MRKQLKIVEESIANLKVELKEIKFTKNKFDDELKKVIKNINEIKSSNIELDEVEELSNKLEEYSKVGLKEGLEIEIDSFIKVRDGLKSNYLSEKTRAEIEKEKKQIVLGLLCWYISLLLIGITGWIWYTIA